MDEDWNVACSVVDSALAKKYGTARTPVEYAAMRDKAMSAPAVVRSRDAATRRMAIVEALVGVVEAPKPVAPVPVAPSPVPVAPSPVPVAPAPVPATKAGFVVLGASSCEAWTPRTAMCGTITALYIGAGAANIGEVPWPCVLLRVEGATTPTRSARFTLASSAGGRCLYTGELPVVRDASASVHLSGCDGEPVAVAWEARIGERLPDEGGPMARVHRLRETSSSGEGPAWWADCVQLLATDSSGAVCGAVAFKQSDGERALTIEPSATGAHPSSVYLAGGSASLCVETSDLTPPTAA